MDETPVGSLMEIGKRFNGKLKSINLLDANVCRTESLPERPWELVVVSGEPFLKQLTFTYRGHRTTAVANSLYLHMSISAVLSTELLTVNEKNMVNLQLKKASSVTLARAQYPIFTDTGFLSDNQRQLLATPAFVRLLEELALRPGEKLNFSSEDISVYLKNPPLDRILRSADRMIDLAEEIKVAEAETEIDLGALPLQFQPLIPLIKKWAIGDDAIRDDFIQQTTKDALESFVISVEPYLHSIDSYLDSFGTVPPPYEAVLLGRLAECAVEAKRELQKTRR